MKALLAGTVATLALVPLAGTVPAQPAAVADVYLLAGQSNMQGAGLLKDLPANSKTPQEGVFFWNGSAFAPLIPGRTPVAGNPGNFGPEIGFSVGMRNAKPATPIYLVKFALGGQPLHYGWKTATQWAGAPPGPNRATFYPGRSPDDPNTGLHYLRMRERFGKALAALDSARTPYKVRGLVWMQGEADAKHPAAAAEYAEMLRLLKTRLEQDLKTPNLPLVYGQVLPYSPPEKRFVARDELRGQMQDADHRSGKPGAMPGAWMVSTDGFPLNSDHVHYNAAGQWRLGTAFAKTMLEALGTPAARPSAVDTQPQDSSR